MGGGPEAKSPAKRDNAKRTMNADECLRPYKWMKFRMKLSYCAWLRNLPINELVLKAIGTTLTELRTLAVFKLQQLIAKDGLDKNNDAIMEEDSDDESSGSDNSSFSSSYTSNKDSDGFSKSD